MGHTIIVDVDGFHGEQTLAITGRNLRPWNDYYWAIDMTKAEIRAAEKSVAICNPRRCTCGGYPLPIPAPGKEGEEGAHLIPASWVPAGWDD